MLHKFAADIGCIMNLAQPMYVMLVMKIAIVLSKIANVCLNFYNNILHCADLHVVPDLAVPIVLGMDWFTKYNPSIGWKMRSVLLDCTRDVACYNYMQYTIYAKYIHYALLASIITTSKVCQLLHTSKSYFV